MALVWIKKIINETDHRLVFRQNDPTFHPVIHSAVNIQLPDTPNAPTGNFNQDVQVNADQQIIVGSKGRLTCDYFVIPWEGKGRLNIVCLDHGHASVNVTVGGGNFITDDAIKFSLPDVEAIPCGSWGGGTNVEVEVRIKADLIEFKITNANSIPELKQIEKAIIDAIIEAGKKLASDLLF